MYKCHENLLGAGSATSCETRFEDLPDEWESSTDAVAAALSAVQILKYLAHYPLNTVKRLAQKES
jgi:hypothetical protein